MEESKVGTLVGEILDLFEEHTLDDILSSLASVLAIVCDTTDLDPSLVLAKLSEWFELRNASETEH